MSLILSNTLKSQISKILWITVGWTFISVFYVLIVYASLIDLENNISERDVSDLDLWLYINGGLLAGILGGIIGGSLVVFFWEKWLRTKNYGSSLWSILWTYTVIYFIGGIPPGLLFESGEVGLPFYHARVWQLMLSTTGNEHDILKFFLGILIKFQFISRAFKVHNLLITRKI